MDFTHGGNVYKAAREKNIDVDKIIDFSANINPLGLSQLGDRRLKEHWSGLLHYPDPEYVALKAALAKFHNCSDQAIFLGNGAIEVIFFLMSSLHPQNALVLAPTFVEYERALNIAKSQVGFYYLCEDSGFKLDVEAYISAAKDYECLVICNPNNPTGQLICKENIRRILDFATETNKFVVLDEAFMDFTDAEESQSCIDLIGTYTHLFILRSITKFFAVPGLRLGYVLTTNEAFSKVYREEKAPWGINHFAQEYTIGALEDEAYIKASRAYVEKERKRLYSELLTIEGIEPYESMGNYIFLKYLGNRPLKEALANMGILIRSCDNYRGLNHQFFRVAVKKREENTILIQAIKEIL